MTASNTRVARAGLSPEEKLHGVKYIIESFMGCIKDMRLSAGKSSSEMEPIRPLVASKYDNVQEGCINRCVRGAAGVGGARAGQCM